MMLPNRHDPDEALDRLAARLRALPDPPVPTGLEVRLLASLDAQVHRPRSSRHRARWGVAAAGVMAASLAGLLLWPRPPGDRPNLRPPEASGPVTRTAPHAASHGLPAGSDASDIPGFRWPIQERSPLTASIATVGRVLDL